MNFDNLQKYVVEMRRYFHQHAELSLMEEETSKKIAQELEKMGIQYYRSKSCPTGIIAEIQGKYPGKRIAFRADIDALPIEEKNNLSFCSKNKGCMHACGHDAHIAILLGTARLLFEQRECLHGSVRLIFEPAEETGAAGFKMLAEGMLDDVDNVFAYHVLPDIPSGKFSVESGPRMAGAGGIKVIVRGKGGHGAMPHQGVDAIMAACAIITNLQTFISREVSAVDPVVLTIGTFHAGTKSNILADRAEFSGTIRFFNPELKDFIVDSVKRIVKHTAAALRAEVEIDCRISLNPAVTDEFSSDIAKKSVIKICGEEALYRKEKITTSDDYALYLQKVPGIFAFFGIGNAEIGAKYPLHHPDFKIDEEHLSMACRVAAEYAVEFLNNDR